MSTIKRRVRSFAWYLLKLARERGHRTLLVSEDTARAYLAEHQHTERWIQNWQR